MLSSAKTFLLKSHLLLFLKSISKSQRNLFKMKQNGDEMLSSYHCILWDCSFWTNFWPKIQEGWGPNRFRRHQQFVITCNWLTIWVVVRVKHFARSFALETMFLGLEIRGFKIHQMKACYTFTLKLIAFGDVCEGQIKFSQEVHANQATWSCTLWCPG